MFVEFGRDFGVRLVDPLRLRLVGSGSIGRLVLTAIGGRRTLRSLRVGLLLGGALHDVKQGLLLRRAFSVSARVGRARGVSVRCDGLIGGGGCFGRSLDNFRSEEHTSELQSLMRISYAAFCLT